jgi:hypothetical protein
LFLPLKYNPGLSNVRLKIEKDEKDLEAGYWLSHFWQGFGGSAIEFR